MDNQKDQESIVRKVLTTEVKYIIGVLVFLFGVATPYYNITKDIEMIRNNNQQMKDSILIIEKNHFSHIEKITSIIEELQKDQVEMKKTEVELMTIISERLPRKTGGQ